MAVLTTKQEDVLKELSKLPEDSIEEVLDFIKFLNIRDNGATDLDSTDEEPTSKEKDGLEPEQEKAWQDL